MADISTLIFEELKREITTLKVIPGGRISEADICERFSVTRPPVRTAFQRLQDIGLLETVPYKGARATLIIEELEHNLRIQKLHINEKEVDEKEFFRLDCEMHQFWFDKMRCSEVWKMIQSDINYERFRMLDFVGTLGYQEIVRSHEKLLDVIKNKEISKITPILSEHLNAGLARMGNLIRTDYKQYFILDDQDNDYWVSYNKKINSGK